MEQLKVDFFVIGAARSGTTSLYNYLKQHPMVFLPNIKELNFFSEVTSNDPEEYEPPHRGRHYHTKIIQALDTYQGLFEAAESKQLKGDISPSYLWEPETANRIWKHNPNAKIIVTLRNPVKRAYSHYQMNYSVGYERNKTFEKALKAPSERVWSGGNLYLEWSSYYAPLKAYYQKFNRENILVLVFEEWVAQREQTMNRIFDFLGIQPHSVDITEEHNKKVTYKNIKVLNALRTRFIKKIVSSVVSQKIKDRWKERLFAAEDVKTSIDPFLKKELEGFFLEEVLKLEGLTQLPLSKLWEFNKAHHDQPST
ncbi:MAG TPA: sulfotransferase [Flavobacteriaceae bacterium]|nr:sulfotransferase [Flavobacteriaceae bacterium]MCB9211921.1 sulfotransferase [Alteromonas sp.]HPF09985.1 sulfotransferase [Flavobacteriaceae bacterium]HQU20082.1 sulfotransferase [Flavobacteriaceae bacterium]HQU63932.1 sulfotransferase [Flavobacteriaceae bacterium]